MNTTIRTMFTMIAMTAIFGYSNDMNHSTTPLTSKDSGKKNVLAVQTTCPVMGGKIDKSQYVDYQGKRIYVCCPGCKGTVAKDPEKFIKKLESMGQSVEILKSAKTGQTSMSKLVIQKTCPVMGNPIDKNIFIDYKGQRVYFCCTMCPAKFKQDPEKYLKKLNDLGEVPEKINNK